tara:strand:+ start:70 stop:462 length:393 start_codon:yes stop_codon:yes gene_type:complete
MTNIVLLALALALIQILVLPALLNLILLDKEQYRANTSYLLSNRDKPIQMPLPVQRVSRAAANLQETLPLFLTLVILGIIAEENLVALGYTWLALRVSYLLCYSCGIEKIRSLIWVASVTVLVVMAFKLI